jgi:hypothetical protein
MNLRLHPDHLSATLDAALNGLASPRYELVQLLPSLPSVRGLYAIYGDDEAWSDLGLADRARHEPLYVGKSKSSLADRNLKAHFGTGRTGSSTIRRTFAALLRDPLGLRAIPRNPQRPERFANYGLSAAHDERLTTWMRNRLQIAVWPTPALVALSQIEVAVIGQLQPPLNLTHTSTPLVAKVKAARAEMAAEARAWASRRSD